MDVGHEVTRVLAEMRAQADPVRAEQEKRYLKSELAHIGVPVPALRKVAVSAVKPEPTRDELVVLAEALWDVTDEGRPVHEARMAAIEVLVKRAALLEPRDVRLAERFIRDSASWVYVDHLAEKVVGGLVVRYPDLGTVLDAWVGDPYMWIRRSAVLALLAGVRAGDPDLERLDRFGDAVLGETDFFIRKALGWVLRELSKKDPDWVVAWVLPRTGALSGVTLREAVRRLPEEDAALILNR
ncbi:3-methyladenine DNA glycosylase AlkD [Actinomadura pelletieri DSM 43383]|uniref:3-methyladenine DNA glycosylase AlkD n=1 Tax=Actinomadura pelletieri DSM 43383 TaxID=1120940 RepID=A0A495QRT1_9ACTN|nr:DNA alkylation repair protein [Actinomadura pelletieri]RKS76188.1 3-methyladenine DNA glycosylase AlkD [Actinomadura pelletieri DSM 43383]